MKLLSKIPPSQLIPFLSLCLLLDGCDPADSTQSFREWGDTRVARFQGVASPDTATLDLAWRVLLEGVPSAVAAGSDGTVYVAVPGEGILRIVPDGSRAEPLGRNGSADPLMLPDGTPDRVSGLAALPEGRLAVRLEGSRRLLLLGPSGAIEAETPLPEGLAQHGHQALALDGSGRLYLGVPPRFPEDGSPISLPRAVYLSLGQALEVGDTLWVPAGYDRACPILSEEHFQGGGFEDIRTRYFPMVKWGLHSGGGLVVGCPASFELDRLEVGGGVTRISREWTPVPLAGPEREGFELLWSVQMRTSGRPGREAWAWRGPRVPETKPAYHEVLPTPEGRIWVWPAGPSVPQAAPQTWPLAGLPDTLWLEPTRGAFEVFGEDGGFLGHVPLPEGVSHSPFAPGPAPVMRGDTLWAVTREGDASGVARFTLSWPKR